jgi:hypothetical protein
MSAGWVAGSVRARAMSRRRLGAQAARTLAGRTSLELAVDSLADSPYGHDVHPGQSLGQAQHAVSATVLWNMRVLAGWLPTGSSRILRLLAGGFEVANVDERLRELDGHAVEPPFRLGSLGTTWERAAHATSAADIRAVLARSPWGDPGSETPAGVGLGMRLAWAGRVASGIPQVRPWACGAAAIVVARELLLAGSAPTPQAQRALAPLLGSAWTDARTVAALASCLPAEARWVLDGIEDPEGLWRAEAAWWSRLSVDGSALLRRPGATPAPVIGSVAVMAVDAWCVRAALGVAARGGSDAPHALEVFDAVA